MRFDIRLQTRLGFFIRRKAASPHAIVFIWVGERQPQVKLPFNCLAISREIYQVLPL